MRNAQNPAGVIIVGGWDDALASEVDKCIDKKVPTVVTDGDLPMSKRLTYLGTNWYNLGYQHGQYQCRYHKEAGLTSGEIGTISFLAASNFIQARQGLRDALAKECPDVKVVADEESGTNVEQVAANTAAIIQGHPNLSGMVGFDSEAGPGIVRAVTEAGQNGKIIITSNEAGRDFLNTIKDGTVKMINMEKYETMDFFAVMYLYVFHNDIIRNLGMDQWLQKSVAINRRLGPDLHHKGQRGDDSGRDRLEIVPAGPQQIRPGAKSPRAVQSFRRLTMTRTLTLPGPVSLAEFNAVYESVKNWGRWGPDDERGTMNYITPDKIAAAAGPCAKAARSRWRSRSTRLPARIIRTRPCISCRGCTTCRSAKVACRSACAFSAWRATATATPMSMRSTMSAIRASSTTANRCLP